jgi:hypothetical protein
MTVIHVTSYPEEIFTTKTSISKVIQELTAHSVYYSHHLSKAIMYSSHTTAIVTLYGKQLLFHDKTFTKFTILTYHLFCNLDNLGDKYKLNSYIVMHVN